MERDEVQLGNAISRARYAKRLSTRELADLVQINQSTVVRLEGGAIATPQPAVLADIARVLDLNLADLYALAGFTRPTELPEFTPYLRSKFAGLPPAARDELERSFRHVAAKYGYDRTGPLPGQDEH